MSRFFCKSCWSYLARLSWGLIVPLLAGLPFFFRAGQCTRRYIDTKECKHLWQRGYQYRMLSHCVGFAKEVPLYKPPLIYPKSFGLGHWQLYDQNTGFVIGHDVISCVIMQNQGEKCHVLCLPSLPLPVHVYVYSWYNIYVPIILYNTVIHVGMHTCTDRQSVRQTDIHSYIHSCIPYILYYTYYTY